MGFFQTIGTLAFFFLEPYLNYNQYKWSYIGFHVWLILGVTLKLLGIFFKSIKWGFKTVMPFINWDKSIESDSS